LNHGIGDVLESRVVDPDSMGCQDPDSESGSKDKKKRKMKKKSNPVY
jgi:hypothetical protein